ncbi:TrkH-domain-containing protein [Periconia macrospinosa]|uniref:TrkH-domain-containing protein n=1 Tax=Periconia macrospinosa TaxID=97972 RepID=A0A2V1DG04_9PLEO|nr:TrkH-domain-containing protein [Periconia macrospinosa]
MDHPWWDNFRSEHPNASSRLETLAAALKPYVPPVNFITIHYAYFIITTLIGTLILWGASSPPRSIGWWDCLFMVTSAVTGSGLNTVNVSQLTTFQQVELAVLMIIGSQVAVSWFTIAFRKHIFEKRFEDIVESERAKRKNKPSKTGSVVGMAGAMFGMPVMSSFGKGRMRNRPQGTRKVSDSESLGMEELGREETLGQNAQDSTEPDSAVEERAQQHHIGFLEPIRENGGPGEAPASGHSIYKMRSRGESTRQRPKTADSGMSDKFNVKTFVTEQKSNIGKHGQFFNLSSDEREYLGGVEYRSLKFLSFFVMVYFVLWQVFGAIALGAWMAVHETEAAAVNGQNPWWAGIFLAISAYNNTGFTLLDAGFLPFQSSYFLLVVVTILSLAGPAAFPVFMRFMIWTMSKMLNLFSRQKEYGVWKEGFDFILRFPRRVYISMFPRRDTWAFVITFTAFVVADWILILILGIGNPTMEAIPVGQRIFISLFEGFSIPSGGYAIVAPSAMYHDVQVLWLVIFYTAAYPHIITMRRTNVYEERALGIYEGDETEVEQLHSASSSLFDVDAAIPGHSSALDTATLNASIRSPSSFRAPGLARRGTAFVGRQIQRSMSSFQGVGVANRQTLPPKPLRRAVEVDFSRASIHSLENHSGTAPPSLLSQQVRGQLSHDVWWIALALFLITIIETAHSKADPVTYGVFPILFEIVSGYTNIGISIGLPDQAYSLSGGLYTGSKIIMVLVMMRGRHRGLPVALDRAVRLPGKKLAEQEEEDAEIRSMHSAMQ